VSSEVILVRSCNGELVLTRPSAWPDTIRLEQCESATGRAAQMNAGARRAQGRWLWFLHADTRMAASALSELERFVARNEDALGWFDLAFRDDGPALTRLNAFGARLRSRWFGLPFGDQGFVIPARTFARLGGYDETVCYGEDHLLVWSAHAANLPVRAVAATLSTSARKYATLGWLRTTLRHWRLTLQQALPAWWRLRRNARR